MTTLSTINSILKSNTLNKEVIVQGWVKTFRSNRFINLNDGSCIEDLQCVLDYENTEKKVIKQTSTQAGQHTSPIFLVLNPVNHSECF